MYLIRVLDDASVTRTESGVRVLLPCISEDILLEADFRHREGCCGIFTFHILMFLRLAAPTSHLAVHRVLPSPGGELPNMLLSSVRRCICCAFPASVRHLLALHAIVWKFSLYFFPDCALLVHLSPTPDIISSH